MMLFGKRNKISNEYIDLRQQLLNSKPTIEVRNNMNGHPVYAAIVDMEIGNDIVSLACFVDGTTSLYYSKGGGQLGLGQAYNTVRTATIAFLHSSEQILDKLSISKTFPLPTKNKNIVYLVTENAIYSQVFDMSKLNSYPNDLKFLDFLYQNVIRAIREAQQQ